MWTHRQNAQTGRWEVCFVSAAGATEATDSAHWLSEASAAQRASQLQAQRMTMTAAAGELADAAEGRPFYAVLCVDEYLEESGWRYFSHFEWAPPPLPLWTLDSNEGGGHQGAEASGSIRTIERLSDGRRIFATGFLATTEEGAQTEAQIEQQVLRHVSVDPAGPMDVEEEITKMGSDGWPIDSRLRFNSYTIGGATVVGAPAIRLACIWLEGMAAPDELSAPLPEPVARVQIPEIVDVSDDQDIIVIMASAAGEPAEPWEHALLPGGDERTRALLASARAEREATCLLTDHCGGPVLPPAEWFSNPGFDRATPLSVTPEGRVLGYIALRDVPHRGFLHYAWSDRIYAPRSASGYAEFLTKSTPVACCADAGCGHERQFLRTGVLALGTTHAEGRVSADEARRFYEDTGFAFADVVCGDDERGVWVSGAVRPGTSDARVREFLGSAPSGDWRWIGDSLELVGVLNVISEGFPVRASAWVEGGEVRSLVAGWGAVEAPEEPEALVASIAARRAPAPASAPPQRPQAPAGSILVDRGRLERMERDLEELRPLIADRIAERLEASLA